ncbi:MAG: polya polymerase [Oribacterium sp.]|nr:polya polymerase [Oribacterium sp.]
MKLENVNNVDGLFEVLNSCSGKVELVSPEGDRINLKSKLSQMIMTAKLLNQATIKELELFVSDPDDMKKVVSFMMNDANKH